MSGAFGEREDLVRNLSLALGGTDLSYFIQASECLTKIGGLCGGAARVCSGFLRIFCFALVYLEG